MTQPAAIKAFTKTILASNASAGLARSMVVSHLLRWNAPHLIDPAVAIVGELFINAVQVSGAAETVKVHASLRATGLWLGVQDSSPIEPTKRKTIQDLDDLDNWSDEEQFGGWGLQIVESLADRFWTEPAKGNRKWVCAEIYYRRQWYTPTVSTS